MIANGSLVKVKLSKKIRITIETENESMNYGIYLSAFLYTTIE